MLPDTSYNNCRSRNYRNGESTTLTASGANTYEWSHNLGTNNTITVYPTTTHLFSNSTSGNQSNSASIIIVNQIPSINISALLMNMLR